LVLILLAALLLLHRQGIITGDIWGYFWPAVVIVFGAWLILGAFSRRRPGAGRSISVPLQGAKSARIKLDHGAGRLNVRSGAASEEILGGVFGNEVDYKSRLEGDRLDVRLRNSPEFWAWFPGDSLDWDISLNREVPISLDIDSGASATVLDLSDLRVVDLDIDTGASSTEVTLPAKAGSTRVDIDTGASSVVIRVPTGVSARLRLKTGVSAVHVDTARFPQVEGGLYQSKDYDSAANRADITIDSGVGSVDIR
jgi:hypothetical protein